MDKKTAIRKDFTDLSINVEIEETERQLPTDLRKLIGLAKDYEMSGSKMPDEMEAIETTYLRELKHWVK